MTKGDIITCGCCGRGLRHTPEENAAYGEEPYPNDEGYGLCLECGGDKRSKSFKKRLGWGLRSFYEARFGIVRDNLSAKAKIKWDSLAYERKCLIIVRMIDKGILAW